MHDKFDKEIFKDHSDYWMVADNIKDIYLSEGSLLSLLDFERVLDELDLYAFKNWIYGELVDGPEVRRYTVTCIFMYPERLMPDPRGARRLLPFDCKVRFKKTRIKIPIKIDEPENYIPGTHKARLVEKPVWLVEITMPKSLMSEIRTGSVEVEGEDIDLDELDQSYAQDLDQQEFRDNEQQQQQPAPAAPGTAPAPAA